MPHVSIIMPVYNAEKYLEEAVSSMLSQTYRDFELLAFDDGSTDSSISILRDMAAGDDRLKILGGEHRGLTHWLNSGMELARGSLLARMDADDVSLPTRLQQQVDYMEQNPDCCLVGGQAFLIDPDGLPIGRWEVPLTHQGIDERHISGKPGGVIHPTAMMRKSVLQKIGGYQPALELAEDYDLFMRLAEVGNTANLKDYLLQYRLHEKSVTLSKTSAQYQVTCDALRAAWVRRKIPGTVPYEHFRKTAPRHEDLLWRWSYLALTERHFETSRKYARRLVAAKPGNINSWVLLIAAAFGPIAFALRSVIPYRPSWGQRQ